MVVKVDMAQKLMEIGLLCSVLFWAGLVWSTEHSISTSWECAREMNDHRHMSLSYAGDCRDILRRESQDRPRIRGSYNMAGLASISFVSRTPATTQSFSKVPASSGGQ